MISINPQDSRPLYEQIEDNFMKLIAAGIMREDDKLPSVRSLASQLAINPNTIQKAYQELETAGITCSVSGKGSFVAGEGGARDILKGRAETKLREALRQARLAGIRKEQAAQWVEQEYEGGGKP